MWLAEGGPYIPGRRAGCGWLCYFTSDAVVSGGAQVLESYVEELVFPNLPRDGVAGVAACKSPSLQAENENFG